MTSPNRELEDAVGRMTNPDGLKGFQISHPSGERFATVVVRQDDLRTVLAALKVRTEALEFYARSYSWRSSTVYMCGHSGASSAELDRGNKAAQALSNTTGEP